MARETIYWDSNAFLGLLNGEPEKAEDCNAVWDAAEKGQYLIVTSCLTVAEVIYAKGVPKLDSAKRPAVNAFFRAPHIAQKPLTRLIAELARDIVWDSSVRPKDAVHVATAGYFKIPVLHTYDDGLIKQGAIDVAGFCVTAKLPFTPYTRPLFPPGSNSGQG